MTRLLMFVCIAWLQSRKSLVCRESEFSWSAIEMRRLMMAIQKRIGGVIYCEPSGTLSTTSSCVGPLTTE